MCLFHDGFPFFARKPSHQQWPTSWGPNQNKLPKFVDFGFETITVNGGNASPPRPSILEPDEMKVYGAIKYCFNQIGINAAWEEHTNMAETVGATFEIYIAPKNY